MVRSRIARQHAPVPVSSAPTVVSPPPSPAAEEIHNPDGGGSLLLHTHELPAELPYRPETQTPHFRDDLFTIMAAIHLSWEDGNPAARVGPDMPLAPDHESRDGEGRQLQHFDPGEAVRLHSTGRLRNEHRERLQVQGTQGRPNGVVEDRRYDPDRQEEETHILGYLLEDGGTACGGQLPEGEGKSIQSLRPLISLHRENTSLGNQDETTRRSYPPTEEVKRTINVDRTVMAATVERTDWAEVEKLVAAKLAERHADEARSEDQEIQCFKQHLVAQQQTIAS